MKKYEWWLIKSMMASIRDARLDGDELEIRQDDDKWYSNKRSFEYNSFMYRLMELIEEAMTADEPKKD